MIRLTEKCHILFEKGHHLPPFLGKEQDLKLKNHVPLFR